jgi:hypothetical protein
MTRNGEDAMTRSRYELALSATVVAAARSAVGEELRRHLPAVQEPPAEITELIARLVALDSVKQRAAEHSAVASLPLQPPLL